MTAGIGLETVEISKGLTDHFARCAEQYGQPYDDYVNTAIDHGAKLLDATETCDKAALCVVATDADNVRAWPIELAHVEQPRLVEGPFVTLPIERGLLVKVHDIAFLRATHQAEVATTFLRWHGLVHAARNQEQAVRVLMLKNGSPRAMKMLSSLGIAVETR